MTLNPIPTVPAWETQGCQRNFLLAGRAAVCLACCEAGADFHSPVSKPFPDSSPAQLVPSLPPPLPFMMSHLLQVQVDLS
jgi:hypothetical protein